MKANYSIGVFISQIVLTFVVLLFYFFRFDPINALGREADTINILTFGIFLPILFSVISIGICLLLGLPLRVISRVRDWWLRKPFIAIMGLALGAILTS